VGGNKKGNSQSIIAKIPVCSLFPGSKQGFSPDHCG